jgi:hypothetical protein
MYIMSNNKAKCPFGSKVADCSAPWPSQDSTYAPNEPLALLQNCEVGFAADPARGRTHMNRVDFGAKPVGDTRD